MNDVHTKKPLRILTHGMSERIGPWVRVPRDQIKDVEQLLNAHGIRYATEENSLSVNGGPFMRVINMRPGTDPQAVQAILDSIP